LLAALMLIILLMPFAQRGPMGRILVSGLSTAVMLGGIYAVSYKRKNVWIGLLLMSPAVVVQWVSAMFGGGATTLFLEPELYAIPFFAFVIWLLFRYVFRHGKVTRDHLAGAACIYLLLGTVWGSLFYLTERMSPGSFHLATPAIDSHLEVRRELTYFSYITLTSLGYGEIVPVHPMARSLTMLEAIVGVLYVGVLVARLAGMIKPPDSASDGDAVA
jgi:hypothetical protein